jgi:hypothetical protein
MSAIWESANWTRQFGIRQTENRQFIHICITYWRRDDWPFIYFVIFLSMDEKTECRSLYFLVSNWTRQFGIRQTENRQFGMLPGGDPPPPSFWIRHWILSLFFFSQSHLPFIICYLTTIFGIVLLSYLKL